MRISFEVRNVLLKQYQPKPVASEIVGNAPAADIPAAKPAPAGLLRTAMDGERNGRLSWVPGAKA
jgi:hypothetical protein